MNEVRPLIYIIDDNDDYRFMVNHVFKRFLSQYRTKYFASGMALCLHVLTNPVEVPCLLLMDNHMPGQSGPQSLTMIRQHALWKEIPAIIMSSSITPEDQQEAYDSGADSYSQKPTTMKGLIEELGQLCEYWSEISVGNSRSQR